MHSHQIAWYNRIIGSFPCLFISLLNSFRNQLFYVSESSVNASNHQFSASADTIYCAVAKQYAEICDDQNVKTACPMTRRACKELNHVRGNCGSTCGNIQYTLFFRTTKALANLVEVGQHCELAFSLLIGSVGAGYRVARTVIAVEGKLQWRRLRLSCEGKFDKQQCADWLRKCGESAGVNYLRESREYGAQFILCVLRFTSETVTI
uniref:ShKT domain-containing protein n=1 Tax=Ascaris lumbricoides TaxID=6252 RepID=A0A0M3I2C3_ASCLU